ncbi:MAG: nucleotidyltransferase domain-containing protein, partial [Deltaproteobacteria bacterium]
MRLAYVFGSAARGAIRADSDADVAVARGHRRLRCVCR